MLEAMDMMTRTNGHDDTLSPEQAAVLLGCSPRTVRRQIAAGRLAGTTRPCSTTRAAVDTFRLAQQGVSGEVLPAGDNGRGQSDKRAGESDREVLLFALREIERLALQVGRLEAELDHCRQSQGQQGQQGQQGHADGQPTGANGHRGGALARLGLWLRR